MKKLYWKSWFAGKKLVKNASDALSNTEGMGTVEIILIILVLIGLVIIFKEQLNDLVNSVFTKITTQAGTI